MTARSRSGLRPDDAEQLGALHNRITAELIRESDSPREYARKLLVLADSLRNTVARTFQRDFEAEGIDLIDRWFAARAAGERGEDAC